MMDFSKLSIQKKLQQMHRRPLKNSKFLTTALFLFDGQNKNKNQDPCFKNIVITLERIMKQQQTMKDELELFNCLVCHKKANKPIVTQCGHLHCWRCYYSSTQTLKVCSICANTTDIEHVYPIFIDNEQVQEQESHIPQRPSPVNLPKIPNSAIAYDRAGILKNNIIMGRSLSGHIFVPSLSICTYSQMGQSEQGDAQKAISLKLKFKFIASFAILTVLIGFSLLY